MRGESRITDPIDYYPTTYSHSHSILNSVPGIRQDETQYKFVPSGDGNGLLYPVGTTHRGQTSISSRVTSATDDQRRETQSQRYIALIGYNQKYIRQNPKNLFKNFWINTFTLYKQRRRGFKPDILHLGDIQSINKH